MTIRGGIMAGILIGSAAAAHAGGLSMPPVFSDGMVLQREQPIPVWGEATPETPVTVKFDGEEKSAQADSRGRWELKLGPRKAGGPFEMTIQGDKTFTIKDILIGDVWICSGQSNMAFTLDAADNGKEAAASASIPQLRQFSGKEWKASSPETAGKFTAVGFFFGRHLVTELKVPVGLINAALGGTPIKAWTRREALWDNHFLKLEVLEPFDRYMHSYPERLATWKEKIRAEGKDPEKLQPDFPSPQTITNPGACFEHYIRPVVPFGIKGAIWYQGESDAWGFTSAAMYKEELITMIRDWRRCFGQVEMPFLIIQLPGDPKNDEKSVRQPSPWNVVQETEWLVQKSLPNVFTASTSDMGEADIHPKRKEPVGVRLATLALAKVYGRKLVCQGPSLKYYVVEGDKIRLAMDNVGGGLVAKGGEIKGLTIAGEDRHFFWAKSKIDGDTILAWSDKVPVPAAVRYSFSEGSAFNLYNAEDLPATPFRTDEWPFDIQPREARSLTAARTDKQWEVIDKIDGVAWSSCEAASDFTVFHSYRPAAVRTEVKIAYDDNNLYVALKCLQAGPATAKAAKRDDEAIWMDDYVEIMVDPSFDRRNYFRFAFNPKGSLVDAKCFNDAAVKGHHHELYNLSDNRGCDPKWSGNIDWRVDPLEGGWTVVARIPWNTLGLERRPGNGTRMGLQIVRHHAADGEFSEWATTGRDENTGAMMPHYYVKGLVQHYAVSRFGLLAFQ